MATLELREVTVRGRGRPRLDGVSLQLEAGELVGLIGPNGAGKTSLLACLAGSLNPDRGEVLLDGRPLHALPRAAVARTVACLLQPLPVTDLPVAEVVRLGRLPHRTSWPGLGGDRPRDRLAVARAMATLDLTGLRERPLSRLSQGERQRALLAMCLAQEAQLLLLDEPTASLDPRHARQILGQLQRLTHASGAGHGLGALVALHDLTWVGQVCDRVVVMTEGHVVADGPPSAVLTPPLLETVYGVPLTVVGHPSTGRPVVLP